jgi:hypothetical protein
LYSFVLRDLKKLEHDTNENTLEYEWTQFFESNEEKFNKLKEKFKKFFPKENVNLLNGLKETLSFKYRHLITLYDLDENNLDIDAAIFSAVFSVYKSSDIKDNTKIERLLKKKLDLAMNFKRCDIARRFIFNTKEIAYVTQVFFFYKPITYRILS